MSKFIELTDKTLGDKVFVNVDRINTLEPKRDRKAIIFMSEEEYIDAEESYEQVKHLIETGEPLDNGKLYRIQLGDYYIGLSKPDNKIHMGYNSEDNKYYQRIFTLPQIYKLDPRLLPLAVEVTT